jgi:hypothetical protein
MTTSKSHLTKILDTGKGLRKIFLMCEETLFYKIETLVVLNRLFVLCYVKISLTISQCRLRNLHGLDSLRHSLPVSLSSCVRTQAILQKCFACFIQYLFDLQNGNSARDLDILDKCESNLLFSTLTFLVNSLKSRT